MSTHPQYHQQRYKDTCVDLLFCYHLRVCGQAHNPLISDSLDYVRLNKQDRTPSRCQPTMPRRQARWMMCSIADRRFPSALTFGLFCPYSLLRQDEAHCHPRRSPPRRHLGVRCPAACLDGFGPQARVAEPPGQARLPQGREECPLPRPHRHPRRCRSRLGRLQRAAGQEPPHCQGLHFPCRLGPR